MFTISKHPEFWYVTKQINYTSPKFLYDNVLLDVESTILIFLLLSHLLFPGQYEYISQV